MFSRTRLAFALIAVAAPGCVTIDAPLFPASPCGPCAQSEEAPGRPSVQLGVEAVPGQAPPVSSPKTRWVPAPSRGRAATKMAYAEGAGF